MPQDPNATLDDAPEQDDEGQDTAEDTRQETVDWETRYKELQKHSSKQLDQMRRELEAMQGDEPDDEPDDDEGDADEPAQASRGAGRLERDSWNLAEQIYGSTAIDAYTKAERLIRKAETPADYIAAFEAYHEARLGEQRQAPKQDAAPDAPADIESGRPDASPDLSQFDQQAEAAKASGDLRGLLAARLRRIGVQ